MMRSEIERAYNVELRLDRAGTRVFFKAEGDRADTYARVTEALERKGEKLRLEILSRRLTDNERRQIMRIGQEHGITKTARMLRTTVPTIDSVMAHGQGNPGTIARLRSAIEALKDRPVGPVRYPNYEYSDLISP
jgi:hypothetical protein